jgi:hypothetical protein
VAGFAGRTRRGPPGARVRVEGIREYEAVFGGLWAGTSAPYALRGYFENQGQVAHVVRVCGASALTSSATLTVGATDALGNWSPASPAGGGFVAAQYRVQGTSPGAWANGTRVSFAYRLRGLSGTPEVDVLVDAPDEPRERLLGIAPGDLEAVVTASSRLVRLTALPPAALPGAAQAPGPQHLTGACRLSGGTDAAPSQADYAAALQSLGDEGEVALVCLPDLRGDLPAAAADDFYAEALRQAAPQMDRLVLVDAPPDLESPPDLLSWLDDLRANAGTPALRAAACYHPPLLVPDPLGGVSAPLRSVTPCGHVAGMASYVDRVRGAHYSPANVPITDAVDVSREYTNDEHARLNPAGLNLVRCIPGRGLAAWGARTLDLNGPLRFVGHRRLLHRLVRAIRRVAEPLVFEVNGPELWLMFTRAVTSVLLQAFRGGALKGETPQEGFRVTCDQTTNPQDQIANGACVCLIEIAPAAPMEFIVIRVALSRDGAVEVLQ